jgi:hypothetical protein
VTPGSYQFIRTARFNEEWERALKTLDERALVDDSLADLLYRALESNITDFLRTDVSGLSAVSIPTDQGTRYLIRFRPPVEVWIEVIGQTSTVYLDAVVVY